MVGAASLWPWLWRRSVLATVLGFSCCTRRGNRGCFFSGFVACFVSVRDHFLFFCCGFAPFVKKRGSRFVGDSWRVFIPEFLFCNLTRDECLETKEKMARWDSDDFSPRGPTFCEILLAIILPPIGVFLKYGCAVEFWLCVLLTLIGYLPGILYAIYVLVQ